jgi:hypothetical protein
MASMAAMPLQELPQVVQLQVLALVVMAVMVVPISVAAAVVAVAVGEQRRRYKLEQVLDLTLELAAAADMVEMQVRNPFEQTV